MAKLFSAGVRGVAVGGLLLTAAMALSQTMSSGGSSTTGGWSNETTSLSSALNTVVKQVSASADYLQTNIILTGRAGAEADSAISTHEAIITSVDQYAANTGQLSDPCYQDGMARSAQNVGDQAEASAQLAQRAIYGTSDTGQVQSKGIAGWFGGRDQATNAPFAANVAQRQTRHVQRYCSVSEAQAGYCTLQANGMQGADSDFSVIYTPGQTHGFDQAEAAGDFVKTIAPARPAAISASCSSAECIAALQARRQDDVAMSMGRYSFMRFAQSRQTQADGEATNSGESK